MRDVPGHGLDLVQLTLTSVVPFMFMQNVLAMTEILLHKLLTNQNHIKAVFAIKLRKLVSRNFAFKLVCL